MYSLGAFNAHFFSFQRHFLSFSIRVSYRGWMERSFPEFSASFNRTKKGVQTAKILEETCKRDKNLQAYIAHILRANRSHMLFSCQFFESADIRLWLVDAVYTNRIIQFFHNSYRRPFDVINCAVQGNDTIAWHSVESSHSYSHCRVTYSYRASRRISSPSELGFSIGLYFLDTWEQALSKNIFF